MKKKNPKANKQPVTRNTMAKKLAQMPLSHERLMVLLRGSQPRPRIRRDAGLLVGRWRAVLALIDLESQMDAAEKSEFDNGIPEKSKVDNEIAALGRDSLDALAVAFSKWDADFFASVAMAMRETQTDLNEPSTRRRIAVEHKIEEVAIEQGHPPGHLDRSRKRIAIEQKIINTGKVDPTRIAKKLVKKKAERSANGNDVDSERVQIHRYLQGIRDAV